MKEMETGSGVSLFSSTEECEDTGGGGGGGVYLGQTDEDGVFITDPSPASVFLGTEGWILQTPPPPHCGANDSESEDVFTTINPNEIFAESDSSEVSDSTHCQIQAPPTIYQVVYDISGVGVGQEEQQKVDVISIDLDEWSSPVLMSDGCLVGELPLVSAVKVEQSLPEMSCSTHGHTQSSTPLYPELSLTEEEQKLLSQEGVSLPNNLPLTKAEERLLKKVRRKIRNKQSAQDSRRRKKEYIDGLESKVAACSAQNKELQRTVDQLEKHNMSLLAQLRKLQALVKQTVSKAAQTSTCLLILIVSLTLIIFPSYGPFRWRSSVSDDPYTPTGVISRNILNDAAAPLPSDGSADNKKIPVDVQSSPDQSDMDGSEIDDAEQEDVELKSNDTAVLENRAESLDVDLPPPPAGGAASDVEAAKPAHADEM